MERCERLQRKIEKPEELNGLNTAELARVAEATEVKAIQEALAGNESSLIRAALLRNENLDPRIREAL